MPLVAENSTEHSRFNRPRNRNQPIITTPNQRLPKPSSSSHTRTNNNTHNASFSGLTNKMNKFTSMAFNRLILGCGSLSPVGSDVFCAPPGIGFSSDAAFVDCVQPVARTKRRKHSRTARRDRVHALDPPYGFNARPYHLLPQYFSAEEGVLDQFGELRLDVDNMSYEELVDLSDKIGHAAMGLREDETIRCLRLESTMDVGESKCSICQDEYEVKNEMGRLKCGHCYHIGCIKTWLLYKNSCPICKARVAPHCATHGF